MAGTPDITSATTLADNVCLFFSNRAQQDDDDNYGYRHGGDDYFGADLIRL